MTNPYRAICAELIDKLHEHTSMWEGHEIDLVTRARALLAQSEPQPVPVSERLPGDELCWWFEPDEDDGYGGMWTLIRIRGGTTRYTHWLPANALPRYP